MATRMTGDTTPHAADHVASRHRLPTPSLPHFIRGVPGNDRIKAFSDGIFTITITLLVFGLQVPQVPPAQLATALFNLTPKVLGYIVSFVVLGVYWVGHHNMFMHIRRHDRVLLWLNILFLMFVVAMPFMADLIIEYPDQQIALVVYAGTLVFAGLSLDAIWWYSSHDYHLVDPHIDPNLVAFVHRRVLLAPLMYSIAAVLAFISFVFGTQANLGLLVAKLLIAIVPLGYIVPSPFDRYHHKELTPGE